MSAATHLAPTWVLIHGWGSDQTLWQPMLRHLPGPTLPIDLPGFGDSVDGQSLTPVEWQEYLAHLAQRLPQQCILVGWSLGGMLATELAAREPERVQGLVTIASNPCFVATPQWPEAMAQDTFQKFRADFAAQPTKTWSRFCALQAQGDFQRKALVQLFKQQRAPDEQVVPVWTNLLDWLAQIDNRASLSNLRCPQLHIFGANDALVPAAAAQALAATGVGSTWVVPACGHAPHLSEPAAVASHILEWLQAQRGIDKRRIAQSFAAAVTTYDKAAHVQRLVAEQLVDQAGHLLAADDILDLGCGTGFVSRALRERGAICSLTLADLAEPMVAYARTKVSTTAAVTADAELLPFREHCFDAVLSSLALQWCHDLTQVGHEVNHCLRPGGRFIFSTLGPQTLHELKQAWQQVDSYVHVNDFKSEQQVCSELAAAGFTVETVRRVPVVLRYRQLLPLLRELKAIGAHNMNHGRKRGLSLRSQFKQLERAYRRHADQHGLLPATYDVILVTAIKP